MKPKARKTTPHGVNTWRSVWPWVALALVTALGAFFRLYDLGRPALRADSIDFWKICAQPFSAWYVATHWLEVMGRTGHFPFSLAFTKWFFDFFKLPLNEFSVCLPSALWGVLSVAAIAFAGSAWRGPWFGILAGLMLAVNPFHVQLSREAYHYSPIVVGVSCLLWCGLTAWRGRKGKRPFPWYWHAVYAAGFFLTAYVQLSGWWITGPVVIWLMIVIIRRRRVLRVPGSELSIFAAVTLLFGLPLVIVPWGVPYFYHDLTTPGVQEAAQRVMSTNPSPPIHIILLKTVSSMGWGATPLRGAFTAVLCVLALIALFQRSRLSRWGWGILGALVMSGAIYHVIRAMIKTWATPHHQTFVLPMFLLLIANGLWSWPCFSWSRRLLGIRAGRLVALLLIAAGLLLWVRPSVLAMRLTGSPTPYKEIREWFDSNLPRGTVVVVDRWYEPWNELAIYRSTNVFFTFIIPNEPLDVFQKYNWRGVAENWFQQNPGAAYLEIAKSYWDSPGVGPWSWPRRFFAQHVAITNSAGLELRDLGLPLRDDFYAANSNRVVVEIFYNTRDDILARAKAQGAPLLMLYGSDWGYTKPWQQMQGDFRDWRVLQDAATLELYNLTSEPRTVELSVRGFAAGGAKRVRAADSTYDFPAGQMAQWTLKPVVLEPGLNRIVLKDSVWGRANVPLLVDQVAVK